VALSRRSLVGGQRLTGRLLAVVLCLSMWLALVQADGLGKGFLLSVLLLIWVADTSAYFAGRAFGRTKLAPLISPGKTREGVIGAVIGNLLLALALSQWTWASPANPAGNFFFWMRESIGLPMTIAVTVLLTLLSVMGDLYESLVKRVAGVKDSGTLLPGHGGVLDRIDAVVAVMPVAMCIMTLIQMGLIGARSS
jgi:phosphatidate cytidylyltransferase